MENDSIVWKAYEYEHKDKTPDWFWALGLVAISVVIASIIKGNYVFALFIVVASIVFGYFGARKPELLDYELHPNGFIARDYLYPFEELKAFWVEEKEGENILHLLSDRILMPVLTIPLGNQDPNEVREYLKMYLPEQELRESLSHRIMEKIGF